MVYKKGPAYRVRRVKDIKADLDEAELVYGSRVKSLFFPAGNTIAMPADQLAEICAYGRSVFPELQRITIYGSSRYIVEKGPDAMRMLRESGLSRIHVGFESGDDEVLRRIKKGADAATQIQAGIWVREAGIELSEYVMLGIGGTARSSEHALRTAEALNKINPDFIRLRTFLPKIDTLLLHQIQKGRFQMLSAHQVLREAKLLLKHLDVTSDILSDHYTNYADVHGKLPVDRDRMLRLLETCLNREESSFRSVYIGTQ
jgi:radical SAM superfamily enzyme YgiQ (UPF0313 family)